MNVVFLDCTQNYGRDFAARNSKVEFMVRGLRQRQNIRTVIINGIDGTNNLSVPERRKDEIVGEIITYPYKGKMLGFKKNINDLSKDLKRLYIPNEQNFVILASPYLHFYLIYLWLAHKYNYKILVIADEWVPSVHRKFWIQNFMAKTYSKIFGYYVDGVLPISEYIINKIKKFKKPWLKTPVLADFNIEYENAIRDRGLVYCVFAAYRSPIKMILDAYKLYMESSNNPMQLTLVLTGGEDDIKLIKNEIESLGLSDNIAIKTRLPYTELLNLFKTANGLLIPLNPNNEQDWARFSQKIAEYLSGRTPILTNPVGEINYYFTNKENAVICDYSVEAFAKSFKWIQDNPNKCEKIGKNGFQLGLKDFNLQVYGHRLYDFLKSL